MLKKIDFTKLAIYSCIINIGYLFYRIWRMWHFYNVGIDRYDIAIFLGYFGLIAFNCHILYTRNKTVKREELLKSFDEENEAR